MSTQSVSALPLQGIDAKQILQWLPHRPPMLMLDSALIDPKDLEKITGYFTVRPETCAGHFTDQPIFPGIFWIEMAYQTAGVLMAFRAGKPVEGMAYQIRNAAFHALARPGDSLYCHVMLVDVGRASISFSTEGFVQGKLAFTSIQTCITRRSRRPGTT